MRLGLHIGYWGLGLTADEQLRLVREAESLGFDSVWSAEAYGSDGATVLGWLAGQTKTIKLGSAIFQMPGRSPAMTAMTAATLDQISNGRMLLGIGSPGAPGGRGRAGAAVREAARADARVRGRVAHGTGARARAVRRRHVRAANPGRAGQG